MKKKTAANLVMVLMIALAAALGITLAISMKEAAEDGLGSRYQIKELEDNALTEAGQENTCTITIVCDSVLAHLDRLEQAKLPYIPENAVLLPETTVGFDAGETVFQVLQRVCTAAELQLEYSWTPLYDSYYIEGIGHLYEFDCGIQSGWMYRVNDQFPNYGCSSYQLRDGDRVVWCYTCEGMGTDVGGTWADET